MEKLPEQFKKDWLIALRSGEYKQGKGLLYNSDDDSMCCIGVGEVCLGVDKESLEDLEMPIDVNNDKIGLLIDDCDLDMLAHMNDIEGRTFLEIADFIETSL